MDRQLFREVRALRAGGGGAGAVLAPTLEDLAAMGPNMMDPLRRALTLETALHTTARALRG
ncbi:hypothetical protein [Kitasatospora albolonga]|uniref:hypothetical protein n=1 Tax=Kitasatospora albolonga TaxID=68173 RepID=UPI0031EC2602